MHEPRPAPPALLTVGAVAVAQVATIRCHGPHGQAGPMTTARIVSIDNGSLALRIDRRSAVAIQVVTAPDVVIDVAAPAPYAVVRLSGYASRATHPDGSELLRVTANRLLLVGPLGETEVAVEDYLAAQQDPIAAEAPRVLAHLAEAHSEQLLACVRAHIDTAVDWVVPRGLDGYGLSLTVLTSDGVGELVLGFPDAPVATLAEAARHIGAVLTCPCHTQGTLRRHDGAAS